MVFRLPLGGWRWQPESPRLQFNEAQMLVGSIMDERGAGYASYSVILNHHVEAA